LLLKEEEFLVSSIELTSYMGTIESFEDLDSWRKARELCQYIFELTLKPAFSKDFSLVNQIRASSGSGMDNIAEGFNRGGNKEFIQFLYISNGSLSETQSQLYRALDRKHITNDEHQKGYGLADETIRLNTGMIRYLKSAKIKGKKFL